MEWGRTVACRRYHHSFNMYSPISTPCCWSSGKNSARRASQYKHGRYVNTATAREQQRLLLARTRLCLWWFKIAARSTCAQYTSPLDTWVFRGKCYKCLSSFDITSQKREKMGLASCRSCNRLLVSVGTYVVGYIVRLAMKITVYVLAVLYHICSK